MAIFKASFTKSGEHAKASVRYIQQRPGKDKARTTRQLFGVDGAMELSQAYRLIDRAGKGSRFYRFVISPDPKKEDTRRDLHLREITEKTMRELTKRLSKPIAWVAAEHDDHAPHRHVHVVAIIPRRLNRSDFLSLRLSATQEALLQRKQRDLALGHRPQRLLQSEGYPRRRTRDRFSPSGQPEKFQPRRNIRLLALCSGCWSLHSATARRCPVCGHQYKATERIKLIRKEAKWER